ncbi:MAG: hypothetical protein ACE5J5_05190, partial [Candidatus Hydrothermarchaeales archaeon]
MEEEEYELEEEIIGEEEGGGGVQVDTGTLLIGLGTLILCMGVALAFVIFSGFSSQEVITLTLTEVKGTTSYSGTWWVVVQLIVPLIIIMAGGKLIDKGIA